MGLLNPSGSARLLRMLLLAALAYVALGALPRDALQDLPSLEFRAAAAATATKVLTGRGSSECKPTAINEAADALDGFALVALRQGGYGSSSDCFTQSAYSDGFFKVEHGTVADASGTLSVNAWRVSPPKELASSFVAAPISVWFKVAGGTSAQAVLIFSGNSLVPLAVLPASAAAAAAAYVYVAGSDDALQALTLDDGDGSPVVFVVAPAANRNSNWPLLAPGVEAARVIAAPHVQMFAWRYLAPAGSTRRPHDAAVDWDESPSSGMNTYATWRRYFPVTDVAGAEGVVWQDEVSLAVYLTWFASGLAGQPSTRILEPASSGYRLAAACSQPAGATASEVAYVMVQVGDPTSKLASSLAAAVRVDVRTGAVLARSSLDTSKEGLNIYSFDDCAALRWSGRYLGLAIARTMTQSTDGLNHQGGIAVVLKAADMSVVKNLGQTSGHSFGNSLQVTEAGDFIGMDLGDNYPRGINLWRFNATQKLQTRLVYSFKTAHGTSPQSPAGVTYAKYTEISTANQTFYKWSNDNQCYTELGHSGVIEVADGFLVFFVGEAPPLKNALAGNPLSAPRNLGWTKVPKSLTGTSVLSPGAVETGGFYTFGGVWKDQENKGISWLTKAPTDMSENVSRLKTTRLCAGRNLLTWEWWSSDSYVRTAMMVVDDAGAVVVPETSLSAFTDVRFPRTDDLADALRAQAGSAVLYAGSQDGTLIRYELLPLLNGAPVCEVANSTLVSSPPGDLPAEVKVPSSGSSARAAGLAPLLLALLLLQY